MERALALVAGAKRRPAALTVACHALTCPPAARAASPPRGVGAPARRRGGSALPRGPHAAHEPPGDRGRLRPSSRARSAEACRSCAGVAPTTGVALRALRRRRHGLARRPGRRARRPRGRAALQRLARPLVDRPCPRTTRARACSRWRSPRRARSPALNLLPPAARPWAPSRGQLVTAGMVAIIALPRPEPGLVHVIRTERYLGRRHRKRSAGSSRRRRRSTAWPRSWPGSGAMLGRAGVGRGRPRPALPVLRELTETLPAGAWLQALTMDRQGVELTGQADGGQRPDPAAGERRASSSARSSPRR